MEWTTYLKHIAEDAERFAAAIGGPFDTAVPCCEGWTMRDLVVHTGEVHRQKELIVRERLLNPPEERSWVPGDNLVEWFREGAAELVATLAAANPIGSVWTWYDTDQTVGFWYRRMAHETLIHRIDAEQARGLASEVDGPLATDGIDEILTVMMANNPSWGTIASEDRTARIEVPGQTWMVGLGRLSGMAPASGATYTNLPAIEFVDEEASSHATISGPPGAMDRWLWGRGSLEELAVEGDRSIADALRAVAKDVT